MNAVERASEAEGTASETVGAGHLFTGFNVLLGHVVLVKVDQTLQERVNVTHGLLTGIPANILGYFTRRRTQHHASRHYLQSRHDMF